jgi:inorganic triphosphatase YgiF
MTRHLEVEAKYTADAGHKVPDFTSLSLVSSVEQADPETLHATYFDTDDLALASQHITLRRREGGADAGWRVNLPSAEGEFEVRVPRGRATRTVPKKLRDVVAAVVRDRRMAPVATVETLHTVRLLIDDQGILLAEVAADRVNAQVPRVAPRAPHAPSGEPAGSRSKRAEAAARRFR